MNIYLVTRSEHGYDEYDGFVVAAKTQEEALTLLEKRYNPDKKYNYSSWPDEGDKKAEHIGITDTFTEPTEILSSFNAG